MSLIPRMRLLAGVAVLLTYTATAHAQDSAAAGSHAIPRSDRVAGWNSDLAFWMDQLKKQHYVYKSHPLPPALLNAAQDLSRNIPRYSDERMLFEFQRLAAFIGDGHTYVLPLAASMCREVSFQSGSISSWTECL